MKRRSIDAKEAALPPSPVAASELLAPITSWSDMVREAAITGVEFDLFWYESVEEGAAYFFRWLGQPRSTVLVVWEKDGPTHIECRKAGDQLLDPAESEPINAEIMRLFYEAGYCRNSTQH